MSPLEQLARATPCDLRHDPLTRELFATDASIYQVRPLGVAFPRSAQEAAQVMAAAAGENISLVPRGAGTGLAGGAIGEGLIMDYSRYNRAITDLDVEACTVRVQAGVVLDQLNDFLKPHGLMFGPDVATSSRATIGGMIGNNSSGARVPLYGVTIDHVLEVELVLPDGTVHNVGPNLNGSRALFERIGGKIKAQEALIQERFHSGIIKRWPGYGVDRFLRGNGDYVKIFGGSEGTLGVIFSAKLNLVPIPQEKGMGLIFFDSVAEAMTATVDLLDLVPGAIEHIDDVLFDQTRGQLAFKAARDYLELDDKPCKSILMVEFYSDVDEKLAALEKKSLGVRKKLCRDDTELGHVMNLRKSGLSLLTGCKGSAKPTAGIEDVAVPPDKLPGYVAGLESLLSSLGLRGSYYGHAASGLLHVRPVVDMHCVEDIKKFRQLGEGVSALTKQFKGSLAAEHGVGIARTEFMAEHIGPELLDLMRAIKTELDPKGLMNPGKIFPDSPYRFDTHLRQGAGAAIPLPFEPVLAFAAKDHSFVGNLEQCNGCGGCRKDAPTMCPTYVATGEDLMATRGRSNAIRAVLEGRLDADQDPLLSESLNQALSNCLSCKACTTECPSNVNMALLKAELLFAKLRAHGAPLGATMISRVDILNELASYAPRMANALMKMGWVKNLLERTAGFTAQRPFPPYALERFDHWFHKRTSKMGRPKRGRVILWDDCFVRHNEPNIGKAAVAVLETAGYQVVLPRGRACCGRPAFSTGRLDVAHRMASHNAVRFANSDLPIVFLEPSCYSMFKEDYRELSVDGADNLAPRSHLFEHFIGDLLKREPDALTFKPSQHPTAIHGHCHAKALTNTSIMTWLAERIPGNKATMLKTGCCGMAGAFGQQASKYELSLKVAEPLVAQVNAQAPGTCIVASGTSCRHQLDHLTDVHPKHMAELLAEHLD